MQHFDIAVIGTGSGNSVIDDRFSHLDVAIIERDDVFGGTCLNHGCIPTKMFAVTADYAAAPEQARRLGVRLGEPRSDWVAIRDRIFGRIDPIASGGRQWREQAPNVSVFTGEARFVSPHQLSIGDNTIHADQIVIATGSSPRPLGLEVPDELAGRVYTTDDIMRMDRQPERIVILGGGFVGAEFGHVFASLGTDVTVIELADHVLAGQDREIAEAFAAEFGARARLRLNQRVVAVEPGPHGDLQVVAEDRNGVEYLYFADALLNATGRVRNSADLNLQAAGVEVRSNGQIRVDDTQRTSVPHIWALGDVSSDYLLKHVANAEARAVQHNLLAGPGNVRRTDHRLVPNAVFSDPQVAAVGATEEQLIEWGTPYVVSRQRYSDVAYGWALEDRGHFVKLLADPRSRRLLGAHILGPQAATLIQPLIQAMTFGLDVQRMAHEQYWIHPALPEVVENALLGLLDAPVPEALDAPA
ncbi:MAG: mycothione reductase [Arachnia sp.]